MKTAELLTLVIMVLVIGGSLFYLYNRHPSPSQSLSEGRVSVAGIIACLPHINNAGPQTATCAYGLYDTDHGYYYALDDASSSTASAPVQFPAGTPVLVNGMFIPETTALYNTIGTIRATSVTPTAGSSKPNNQASSTRETATDGVIVFTTPDDFELMVSALERQASTTTLTPCKSNFDYCMYYSGTTYQGTDLKGASIAIKKQPPDTSRIDCLTTPPEEHTNLTTFASSSYATYAMSLFSPLNENATSSQTGDEQYRLFTAHTCYFLTLQINVSQQNSSSTAESTFTAQDRSALAAQLRDVLTHITLVATHKPIQIPPAS